MASAFEPRSSLRSSQQQHANHRSSTMSQSHAPNPPQPSSSYAESGLPTLDFGFDDLRRQMSTFSTRFDDMIATGRRTVLDSRNAHRTQLAKLTESSTMKARSISILQTQQAAHSSMLRKEAAETAEYQGAISALTASRDSAAQAMDRLHRELEATRAAIAERERAQREYAERVGRQARLNAPELAFYEEYLGMRIESPADDEICFVFCCVDERKPETEYAVTLDLSRRDYAVKGCEPSGMLQEKELKGAVAKLNDGRDLAPFLKEVRQLFRARCREAKA